MDTLDPDSRGHSKSGQLKEPKNARFDRDPEFDSGREILSSATAPCDRSLFGRRSLVGSKRRLRLARDIRCACRRRAAERRRAGGLSGRRLLRMCRWVRERSNRANVKAAPTHGSSHLSCRRCATRKCVAILLIDTVNFLFGGESNC